jgi:FlaA1/EpsC-like NDP-sugar epimerase
VINGANRGRSQTRGQAIASMAARIRADVAFAFIDVFVVVAGYTIGLGLRMLDPLVSERGDYWVEFAFAIPFIVLIHLLANVVVGAYGHVWEYASISEAIRLVIANTIATATIFGVIWAERTLFDVAVIVPYTVVAIGGMLALLAMGMVRYRSRLFSLHKGSGTIRTLIVGIGRDYRSARIGIAPEAASRS